MGAVERFLELQQHFGSGWPTKSSTIVDPAIRYFGKVLHEVRDVNGKDEDYFTILRHFGWAVVYGLTEQGELITLAQWKPGVNQVTWEFAPGGIGKIEEDLSLEGIQTLTQEAFTRETGYGEGEWKYLGGSSIESGKYRGATPDSHGLLAHMFLATGLTQVGPPRPAENEIYEPILVPPGEIRSVLESGLILEVSAKLCAKEALIELGQLQWA